MLRVKQLSDPTYEDLNHLLAWTTSQIETILKVEELDEHGILVQGGLNDLYVEILTFFDFVSHKNKNYVYGDFKDV